MQVFGRKRSFAVIRQQVIQQTRNSSSEADAFRKLAATRKSIRFYKSDPIPDAVLKDILLTTQRAPTGFNMQPYACILVRAKKDREMLAEAMLGTNGKKVTDAPVVAVFAADLEPSLRIPHVQKMMHEDGAPVDMVNQLPLMVRMFAGEGHLGGLIRSCISTVVSPLKAAPAFVPTIAWAYKQTSLAASSFLFAAHSHGLGTCPMEGFDETRVKNCLDIPDRYSVPIIIACGYPQEDKLPTKQTPRLPATDLFFDGKFGNSSAKLFD